MRLRVGCSGWSYPEWVGPFYPKGTRQAKFLSLYARAFDAVEVDSTFYRVPSRETVERWREATPDGFTFCPKLPPEVTGGARAGAAKSEGPREPTDAGEVLEDFLRAADVFGAKLGPLVVQFPPSYSKREHLKDLERMLDALGARRSAVEFRNRSWYEPSTYTALGERNVALVWSEFKQVEVPVEQTADFLVVRFIGDRSFEPEGRIVQPKDGTIAKWAGRIETRADHLDETFVFFNNHFEGFGPQSANRFLAKAGRPAVDWGKAVGARGKAQARLGEF